MTKPRKSKAQREADYARSTLQYEQDRSFLAVLEDALATGYWTVRNAETMRDIKNPLSTEDRVMHSQFSDALRTKLARPQNYLPARGMTADEVLTFAKMGHEPELPMNPIAATEAAEAINKRDWGSYFILFDSHQIVFPFLTVHARLTDEEYWLALSGVWIGSEWSYEFGPLWTWLFFGNRDRSGAVAMMNAEERERWAQLPDEVRVYRGQQQITGPSGISWTLSREKAVFFARTYRPRFTRDWKRGPGVVLSGMVAKSDALTYLNSRKEEEVLIPVGKVRVDGYDQP